jgi:hypothetical protein
MTFFKMTSNIPNIRYQMLLGVTVAQDTFYSMLSCKDIGHDSLALQNAICIEFL